MVPLLLFKCGFNEGGCEVYEVVNDGIYSIIEIGFSGLLKTEEPFVNWVNEYKSFTSFWKGFTKREKWYNNYLYFIDKSVQSTIAGSLEKVEDELQQSISWNKKYRFQWYNHFVSEQATGAFAK